MKRKDLTLIIVVVVVSTVFALVLSSAVIGSPAKNPQEAEIVDVITTDFPNPDKRYFNDQAIDPTQVITIGTNENPDPFSGDASQ